ncbi:MAG: flagellar basal-body rod protein FlgF [Bdellovibrionaceae bacterium]|nr:flagellar basal-body rod protein FlgF [Pseudobdellovibrionaceae bacterium]
MSVKGIYTAVSGAMAQSDKLDTIANNLANADTPAFKRDEQVFREYLKSYEKQSEVIEAPRVPASVDSFYPTDGNDKSYVDSAGTFTSFAQGALQVTNNPFDFAIEGEGMFEVLTNDGVRYARAGNFTVNSNGMMVTKQGHPVLMEEKPGNQMQDRMIQVGSAESWNVTPQGEVYIDGELRGKLSVSTAEDKDVFQKQGTNLYTTRETINSAVVPSKKFRLHQGSVEKSNVNIVSEMTDMIKTTRIFETKQKAIQAYDQMNAKLVNDVAKLK